MGLRGLVGSLLPVLVLFLTCLMVRRVVILPVVLSGFGFVCFEGTWLIVPVRFLGFIVCWSSAAEGSPGHGPAHLLIQRAAEIGFRWDPEELAWDRPGSASFEQFVWSYSASSCCYSWCLEGLRFLRIFVLGRVFVGVPRWMIDGTLQLLNSDHVREREIKRCFGVSLLECVWNGFLVGKVQWSGCAL